MEKQQDPQLIYVRIRIAIFFNPSVQRGCWLPLRLCPPRVRPGLGVSRKSSWHSKLSDIAMWKQWCDRDTLKKCNGLTTAIPSPPCQRLKMPSSGSNEERTKVASPHLSTTRSNTEVDKPSGPSSCLFFGGSTPFLFYIYFSSLKSFFSFAVFLNLSVFSLS